MILDLTGNIFSFYLFINDVHYIIASCSEQNMLAQNWIPNDEVNNYKAQYHFFLKCSYD